MIEEYLDTITNMENYADGIIVIDQEAKVVYIRQFKPDLSPLDERRAIGKSIFEIYPTLNPQTSTLIAAIKRGETTMNNQETLTTSTGETFQIIDNTFPIKQDNQIIGAVSVATFPDKNFTVSGINLYSDAVPQVKDLYTVEDIIGRSKQTQDLRIQIGRVSTTSSSVLIYGSTGTGKEMVAQSIHSASERKNKKFISQNCAAIPATLLESIFFGTVKGAYTGAENKAGIFESADGGTIFLDEINSMDINLQAKLLRVLEERKITRIGGVDPVSVNVRIIAATNKRPSLCIQDGTLRPDLFYRLGSVTIDVPDLRDRLEDLPLLTDYFISLYNTSMHKHITGVSKEVMEIFKTYAWPGNVREFRNIIEGAFNLCDGDVIDIGSLPSYLLSEFNLTKPELEDEDAAEKILWEGSLKSTMDAYEKKLILQAVSSHKSLTAAADYLGITRQSLNQKLRKYNL
ncbi:sigma-54 interaction domain-containing protein [Emergencia sp.]|uniref:sigma-54 interaction domain-containing protein n=1 Tax=Emergencia sp. TaxID=1926557 RepID=UPI003AEFE0CE